MKIIERYGVGFRMLTSGIWTALYPARFLLAGIYGLCVAAREGRKPPRERGSIRDAGGMRTSDHIHRKYRNRREEKRHARSPLRVELRIGAGSPS